MGAGFSLSQNTSEQLASSNVMQNFTGTCDITCKNISSGTTIDINNSTIRGGIHFDQTCSASGQCLYSVAQNAAVDTLFFAKNSAQASNAGSWLDGFFNSDVSTNDSYQNIRQNINQAVKETCKIESLNDVERLTILATNSDISGGIDISQSGSATGTCALQANMVGAAQATGNVQNEAQSGKKVGKKGSKGMLILIILGVLALIIVGVIVFVLVRGKGDPTCANGVKAVKPSRWAKPTCPTTTTARVPVTSASA